MLIKKIKHRLAAILSAALVLQGISASVPAAGQETGGELPTEAVQQQATGVNVAYHTQDEIRNYIAASGAAINDHVTFQTEPGTEAPYALGKLSDETLNSAIKMLNQIRYIAGISYDVALDDGYNEMAQAASLVNYVNGKMTHYPEQPQDMPDELYELGRAGAASSNIAWGSGKSWKLNYFIAMSWMEDGDRSNIDRVGHRRWLLNPSMKKTGFGFVRGDKGTHCAVYAFDRSGGAGEYGVMWPAQNMPTDYFNSQFPWSVSMGSAVDASTVKVTLTRESDGAVWSFSQGSADGAFYVNNDGYGQKGCIIFRPDGVTEYKDGDSYEVNITGLSGGDVSYQVNFFDLTPVEPGPTPEVESVSIFPESVNVEAGDSQKFAETVSVLNGADTSVVWTVAGNTSGGTFISQDGFLTVAVDERAAELTVRATSAADYSKYAEAFVMVAQKAECEHEWGEYAVSKRPTCEEKGIQTRTCIVCGQTEDEEIPAMGHSYQAAFNWSDNKASCTAVLTCKREGCTQEPKILDARVTTEQRKTATCISAGIMAYTATVAAGGYTYTDTKKAGTEKDSRKHVGGTEVRNAAAATETKDGYTGDVYCKSCGEKISSGMTIPATGGSPGGNITPVVPDTPSKESVINRNDDGSFTETTVENRKNGQGNDVTVTTIVSKDAKGSVTGSEVVSVIHEGEAQISVTAKKDAGGRIVSATAEVEITGETDTAGKTEVTVNAQAVSQMIEAAGTDRLNVKYTVKDMLGKIAYIVTVNTADLTPGNALYPLCEDNSGKVRLTGAEKYLVQDTGNVAVAMSEQQAYRLVTQEEMDQINQTLLKTVKPAKKTAVVKKGGTVVMKLSAKADKDNIKTIRFASTNKKVVKVNKNGKVTGVKKGKATIKAVVTMKSGVKKTIKMEVKVK